MDEATTHRTMLDELKAALWPVAIEGFNHETAVAVWQRGLDQVLGAEV